MAAETSWSIRATTAWTRAADGAAIVMDMRTADPQQLSPVGSAVWDVLVDWHTPDEDLAPCEGPRTEADIVAAVAESFGESLETVRDDVVGFLHQLAGHGILERTDGPGPDGAPQP